MTEPTFGLICALLAFAGPVGVLLHGLYCWLTGFAQPEKPAPYASREAFLADMLSIR